MNTIFNASAGTGKTYQVTQLYEQLVLEEKIDPRQILLMTFTDNAAAELRMRVAHRFIKVRRNAESDGDDELAQRAIDASSKLVSAPIGTIHAFCTRLLREHALEAGLSPGFAVLIGDEHTELLDRICKEELLQRLISDSDFKTFCAGAHLIGTGTGFGTSMTETVPALIAQAGSLGISLENAEALLPPPEPAARRIDFERIVQRIDELPKIPPTVREAQNILRQALDESDDLEGLLRRLNEMGIKKFGRGGAKDISDDFWQLKTDAEEALRYQQHFPAAQAFARYVQSVAQQFRRRKHEMNCVDFDDQLQLAAQLLQSGRVQLDFRYIIVDEVQDTSRIQCNIIQSLWKGNADSDASLVICGDKKQSIYTWRGADPQVMPDLETAINAADGITKNLQVSYRSKSPLLKVINELFSSVYGADQYGETDRLEPNPDFKTEGETACVEFLSSDLNEELPKSEKIAAEMEAIAHRIELLVNGSSEWQPEYRYNDGFKPVSAENRYRYSDILILLHRTSNQSVLEQALRHADIPYTLGGKGSGLFSRQETRDVSLFLSVLTQPKDALSLVGFLRSPWVGLSDEEIAELAWGENGFSVETLLAHFNGSEPVIPSAKQLHHYREQLRCKLASELVRQLIDETAYDALLVGLPRGEQRLANLRKVLDWLRDAEHGARMTPHTVARKLAELIANPPKIPEAALLDPDQNTVTLMTVHGSKGLTKRVVFVPDLSFSANPDRSFAQLFFENSAPRLGLKITAPDRSSVKSPGFEFGVKQASEVRGHESGNLFYVAMTRARDLVVTSASIGVRSAGWYKHLEPLLGKAIPAISYGQLASAVRLSIFPRTPHPSAEQLKQAISSLPAAPPLPVLQRIPATRLAQEQDEMEPVDNESAMLRLAPNSAALGSLGHAVLEQLALNAWDGSVVDWLHRLRDDFAIDKKEAERLVPRIERTRTLMRDLTFGAQELHPEFPFLLHNQDQLIDGTIDLLCKTTNGFIIFDYKFTSHPVDEAIAKYRAQLEIYRRAAAHRFPGTTEAQAVLILVGMNETRPVPLSFAEESA